VCSSGPYKISDCPEEESLNTWWADSQGSETGLKYCTLFCTRKWVLTSALETLRVETGAHPYSATTGLGGSQERN
jgi:hypothetical protein